MESGAMGVQITISGKLRGDRSAFEKHTAGVLPRAGHHAEVIVDDDVAHVGTPMGLIGIRIRIARKEKLIPEFEMKPDPNVKQILDKDTGKMRDETVAEKKARTESEQIALEAEKMKELEDARRGGDEAQVSRISMKTVRQFNEKDLASRIQEARGELSKLRTEAAKGTLRKKSGKIKPMRRDIARMLTRKREMRE